jgi:hypothetical protein
MPVLFRSGALLLRMYADNHRPPHFHIAGPNFEVIVRLTDLAIIEGTARAKQIEPAMEWARKNKPFLTAKWIELNERG